MITEPNYKDACGKKIMILSRIFKAGLLFIGLNISSAKGQENNPFDTGIIKPRLRVIIDNDFSCINVNVQVILWI